MSSGCIIMIQSFVPAPPALICTPDADTTAVRITTFRSAAPSIEKKPREPLNAKVNNELNRREVVASTCVKSKGQSIIG